MRFYKRLYLSPSIQDKRRQIIWKLKTGRLQPTIYLIALARNKDLFEIYHSGILKQRYYRKAENAPYIVGIAKSYSGAVDLVSEMLTDVWQETGSYDVKAYFG
ncbi:MAG: hypothetical protein NC337_07175 [Roseburia sp.]|nr:hypothetical protein [Roseburia sp.]